jgi:hypothetical protein
MDKKDGTNFLDSKWSKIPDRQRQWHINNQHYTFVLCENCATNSVNWNIKEKRYSRFCSTKCAHTHSSVREKTKQTCLAKYGATTNLSTESNKQKQKETCLMKYGETNFSKTKEFRKKYEKTCMEKYGVTNISKLDTIKEKIDQSHQLRYNRKRHSQIHIDQDIISKKNDREYMLYLYKDLKMPLTEIANQLGINHSQLCVHFKDNLKIDISRHRISWPEIEIFNFIKQYAADAIQSDRSIISPKELDIVIPSKKIAIEYNGLAWHGEIRGNKPKLYHYDKMKSANQQGYRLVQIFSNEWDQQQDLVKSRLKNLIGQSIKKPARKCQILPVSKKDADVFLNENHIQGTCFHKFSYGLYLEGQLMSVMTFGKSRFAKQYEYELLRFANQQNYTVQGGASRLFAHFVKTIDPRSVISYCDLRWNTGNLYQQLGFEFLKNTNPNYWYVIDNKFLENRITYQKHKLFNRLHNYDSNLTEWENMLNNGFDRVWDCGNSVWLWKKK